MLLNLPLLRVVFSGSVPGTAGLVPRSDPRPQGLGGGGLSISGGLDPFYLCLQPALWPRCTRASKRLRRENSSFTLKKSWCLRGSLRTRCLKSGAKRDTSDLPTNPLSPSRAPRGAGGGGSSWPTYLRSQALCYRPQSPLGSPPAPPYHHRSGGRWMQGKHASRGSDPGPGSGGGADAAPRVGNLQRDGGSLHAPLKHPACTRSNAPCPPGLTRAKQPLQGRARRHG